MVLASAVFIYWAFVTDEEVKEVASHWAKTVKFNHSWHKFKNDISIFVKIKSSAVGDMKSSLQLIIRHARATTTN